MNTPRLWFPPEDYPETILGIYDQENCPHRSHFDQGKPIATMIVTPSFEFPASRSKLIKYDILPNTMRVPLISPRVAALLDGLCGVEFQLIPSILHASDGTIDNYYVLNVVEEISGMDHARSSFLKIPNTNCIFGVTSLRYMAGAMGDRHLAREREYHPFLWVSDLIVQKFAEAQFNGYEFQTPESIHP